MMDEISLLPDCLIHSILSFLPTKESVRTSILSNRWTDVWKSVPRLDLNFSDFNNVEKFKSFGDKWFDNPEQLDTFNLRWQECTEESFQIINNWVCNLVFLKPKEVLIDVSNLDDVNVYFFSYLFECVSLERTFLWPCIIGAWASFDPPIVDLPFLKILNLGWIFIEDEFIQRLFAGCPIIEELTFDSCCLSLTEKITCFSLKKLIIRNTDFAPETLLRIFMPNLEYLSCQVHLGRVDFVNLSNLEHANINLFGLRTDYDDLDDLEELKLLKGLSNVKTLQLSGFLVNKMLKKEVPKLPIFDKLENLDLVSCNINQYLSPLDFLLRKTPNIKKLVLQNVSIEQDYAFDHYHLSYCYPPPDIVEPGWAYDYRGHRYREIIKCENLKTVEIVCLKTEQYTHNFVQFLIHNLWGLENISINRIDAIDYSFEPNFIQHDSDDEE